MIDRIVWYAKSENYYLLQKLVPGIGDVMGDGGEGSCSHSWAWGIASHTWKIGRV